MGTFFVGCCSAFVAPLYGSAFLYSFASGLINDPASGGASSYFESGLQQISVGSGKSSLTLNGEVDDLVLVVPPGLAVSTAYNSSNSTTTVTLPAEYLIILPTVNQFTYPMKITDGTHTANISGGDVASTAATKINTATLRTAALGSPIPLSTLETIGVSDAAGNMVFQLIVVPSGTGHLTITSASAA